MRRAKTPAGAFFVRELSVTWGPRLLRLPENNRALMTPAEAAAFLARVLEPDSADVERTAAIFLDARHHLIGWQVQGQGTVAGALVHPREVYKVAVLANASGIIWAHNHPSGGPDPSADDRATMRRLKGAGELLGIELLDAIVLGHGGAYFSFREHGTLAQ